MASGRKHRSGSRCLGRGRDPHQFRAARSHPGYHAAEATLDFTLSMKIARLVMAAATSISAGAVVGLIEPSRRWAGWLVGLIILAMFVPVHIGLWSKFPVWYHLSFLVPLAPLVALGASLTCNRARQVPATAI